jgi:hypothetical protein
MYGVACAFLGGNTVIEECTNLNGGLTSEGGFEGIIGVWIGSWSRWPGEIGRGFVGGTEDGCPEIPFLVEIGVLFVSTGWCVCSLDLGWGGGSDILGSVFVGFCVWCKREMISAGVTSTSSIIDDA